MYKQVRLKKGNTHTQYWLNDDKSFKVGDMVRLKNEEDFWIVEEIYESVKLEKNQINRGWGVGGIDNEITK